MSTQTEKQAPVKTQDKSVERPAPKPTFDPKYELVRGKTVTFPIQGVGDITIEPMLDGKANPQYTKFWKDIDDQMNLALADDRAMLETELKTRIQGLLVDIQEELDLEHGGGIKDVQLLLASWALGVWFGSKGVDRIEFCEGDYLTKRERKLRSDAGQTKT